MSKRDVNWEVTRMRLCMFKELKRPCKRIEFDFRGSVMLWMSLEVRSLQGCKPLKGSGILAWKGRFGPMESQAVDAGYQTQKCSVVCCVGTNKLQFSASGFYASVTGDRKS